SESPDRAAPRRRHASGSKQSVQEDFDHTTATSATTSNRVHKFDRHRVLGNAPVVPPFKSWPAIQWAKDQRAAAPDRGVPAHPADRG
ncbi:MAG: hypothetical protein ACK56I_27180, partial [bacterium]